MLSFLGSRKAFAAGVAFGLAAAFAFPLSLRVGLSQLVFAGRRAGAFEETMLIYFIVIGIGVPVIAALLVAYLTPEARSGRSSYFRNITTWVLAAIAGPAALFAWSAIGDNRGERERVEAVKHFSRPIVDADTAGLCAPPIYGIEDSIPIVTLTARLPRDEHYGFRFDAVDNAGQKLTGFKHADYAAGVQTVRLKAKLDLSSAPIPDSLPPLRVTYPVVVKYLRVGTFHTTLRDDPDWADYRVADTLAVIPGP